MTLSDRQWEFLKDVALLILFAERQGWKLTGGELWRPKEMQQIYVSRGQSNASQGFHQQRLAIDLNLFIDNEYKTATEEYSELGKFWESIRPENRWGGNFKARNDGNHFERYR